MKEAFKAAENTLDVLLTLPRTRMAIQLTTFGLFLGAVTAGPILLSKWHHGNKQAQNAAKTPQPFSSTTASPTPAIAMQENSVKFRQ